MELRELSGLAIFDEAAVVDEADIQANSLGEQHTHALIQKAHDVQAAGGALADGRRCAEHRISGGAWHREKTLSLLTRRAHYLGPRQLRARLCDERASLENSA
jgi:hypothetical protein